MTFRRMHSVSGLRKKIPNWPQLVSVSGRSPKLYIPSKVGDKLQCMAQKTNSVALSPQANYTD
jgi:hypothetical protein